MLALTVPGYGQENSAPSDSASVALDEIFGRVKDTYGTRKKNDSKTVAPRSEQTKKALPAPRIVAPDRAPVTPEESTSEAKPKPSPKQWTMS